MAAECPLPAECEVCGGKLRGLGSTTTALMPQADGSLRAFSRASMKLALQRSGFEPLRIKLQSHSASRFGHYGKRGILGLMANGIGLNKPSRDRDGPVFFPFFDHQLVLAEKPEQ